jgi:hypothetical protein
MLWPEKKTEEEERKGKKQMHLFSFYVYKWS